MNKRNKPASLTGSLLARKGEAEPATEPYSFLEPGDGRAEGAAGGNGAGFPEQDLASSGTTGAGSAGESAATASQPAWTTQSGPAASHGSGVDDGAGSSPRPDRDRNTIQDRRLLRFVYATAALTGVLAVIIYAGGWFFGDTTEQPQGRSRVVVLDQPMAIREQPPEKVPQREPSERPQVSAPPKPPAPPATTETAPQPIEDKAASTSPKDGRQGGTAVANVAKTKVVADESKIETRPKKAETASPSTKPAAISKTPPPASKPTALAARATGTPATTARGRYYIQLASVPTEAAAKNFWARLQKNFPDILGEYDLIVQKRVIPDKGTFYRVQVGRFSGFKDVRGLCELLKARKQPCLPVKR